MANGSYAPKIEVSFYLLMSAHLGGVHGVRERDCPTVLAQVIFYLFITAAICEKSGANYKHHPGCPCQSLLLLDLFSSRAL